MSLAHAVIKKPRFLDMSIENCKDNSSMTSAHVVSKKPMLT